MKRLFTLFVFLFVMVNNSYADFKSDFFKYSSEGKLEELDVLINDKLDAGEKIDFNMTDADGNTALIYAAWNSQAKIINFLMQFKNRGIILGMENKHADTALTLAVYKKCFECAKSLIINGASVDNIGSKKKSALIVALSVNVSSSEMEGMTNLITFLVNNNADVSVKDEASNNVIHLSVRDFPSLVSKFISKGVRVNSKNKFGETPLHIAAKTGISESVRILLENGAYTSLATNEGYTAMHLAAINGRLPIIKLLIEKGEDPVAQNATTGMDAFEYLLVEENFSELEQLLAMYPNYTFERFYSNAYDTIKAFKVKAQELFTLTKIASLPNEIKKNGYTQKAPRYNGKSFSETEMYAFKFYVTAEKCNTDYPMFISFKEADFKYYLDQSKTIDGKMEYKIQFINSFINEYFPGNPGVNLSFSSEAERTEWFNLYNSLNAKTKVIREFFDYHKKEFVKMSEGISSCR